MKIHTNTSDKLVKVIGEHCHLIEKEIINVLEFRAKVKQRAIVETAPVPRIYEEECAKAMLPSEREISEEAFSYA
jgi:hypothetical protein